ncbi:MAG TPA: glutathione peroxidase [Casimicrobiaceae bacterium]|nr:glutathione peroxidase [Casimicrobiaceae bacterium]
MKGKRNVLTAFAIAAAAIGLLAAAFVLTHVPRRDLVADALGPITQLPSEANSDETAGDALADDNGAGFLPVPAPFDDQSVVDAMGPIAKLACRRDDAVDASQEDDGVDPLDAPLGSGQNDPEQAAEQPLVAAALAPLAPLPAPASDRIAATTRDAAPDTPADCPDILRYEFNRLQTGEAQSLCQFRGKVLLIVNTASYCAYTGQYEGLEALYRKYKGRGLVVVGFPSNDFGGQEPGTNQDIARFCRLTYGVQFPMFEKSSVTKVASNPLFATLVSSTGVAPQWNFYKYVVDRHGHPVAAFGSRTTPDDPAIVAMIERLLADRGGVG